MQTKYTYAVLIFFFVTLSSVAFTQTSPQIRRLPPSLERELKLRKGGKIRIVGFTDTLKAQSLIAQSIRDSSSEELDSLSVKDSAIIVIDSSVSLTDKEWLDSMLAELPEYRKTPEGIRFHYPADILVETSRKTVPPDTTLASRMDPVSKEDLPLYDALPMPRPLHRTAFPKTSVEFGVGVPSLPRAELQSLVLSNNVSAVEIDGKYFSTTAEAPAIKQYWKIGASGSFAFADTSILKGERVPQLDVSVSTGANTRLVESERASLSLMNLNARFTIGSLEKLKLESHEFYSLLNESFHSGRQEELVGITIGLTGEKIFPFELPTEYAIRIEYITNVAGLLEPKVLFNLFSSDLLQLKVGAEFPIPTHGDQLPISPIIDIRKHLSNVLEIGASFEPENKLITKHDLTSQNLFYAATYPTGGITTEPIHLNLFANCFLSLNNEFHAQLRYIERNTEPIFFSGKDSNGNIFFTTKPLNTRSIEFEVGGSILAFGKDKLRGSMLFRSASDRGSNITLPYIPTAQIQASYQFGIWEKFIPQIEVMNLERPGHSFTFLNLDAKYIFSSQFQLKFRTENLLGNAGDFWTGYNEYPRSAWVSAQYSF